MRRSRKFLTKSSISKSINPSLFTGYSVYDFVHHVKEFEQDQSMYLRFIKQLPPQILDIYLKELNNKKDEYFELYNISESFIRMNSKEIDEAEFLKKIISLN